MTRERWLFVISLKTWITIALLSLLCAPPLGHDEAQYAVAARADASPWLYLSPGTIAIARIGVVLGGSEWTLRLLPVVLGTGLVVATWFVGRVAFGEQVGAWAAAVIAGAHPLVLRSAELLSDLPAAACILAGVVILIRELDGRQQASWWIVLAAPAFAAAFYVRFGSAPVIAIAGLAAAGLWWRRIIARPAPVVAAVVVFTALLVPHAIASLHATGSVLGILLQSADVPGRDYLGEGLVTYTTSNPFRFYGVLVAPVMLVGLVGIVRPPARWRPAVFLALIAIGQIVALGLETRAQPRYLAVAIVLLVVLGVDALLRAAANRPGRGFAIARRAMLPLVLLSWFGVELSVVALSRHLASARRALETASDAVRADAAGRPCVVAADQTPQIMWKTSCDSVGLGDPIRWPANRRRYLVYLPPRISDVAPEATAIAVTMPVGVGQPKVWYLP